VQTTNIMGGSSFRLRCGNTGAVFIPGTKDAFGFIFEAKYLGWAGVSAHDGYNATNSFYSYASLALEPYCEGQYPRFGTGKGVVLSGSRMDVNLPLFFASNVLVCGTSTFGSTNAAAPSIVVSNGAMFDKWYPIFGVTTNWYQAEPAAGAFLIHVIGDTTTKISEATYP